MYLTYTHARVLFTATLTLHSDLVRSSCSVQHVIITYVSTVGSQYVTYNLALHSQCTVSASQEYAFTVLTGNLLLKMTKPRKQTNKDNS